MLMFIELGLFMIFELPHFNRISI